jgi:hypothetical protein
MAVLGSRLELLLDAVNGRTRLPAEAGPGEGETDDDVEPPAVIAEPIDASAVEVSAFQQLVRAFSRYIGHQNA